MVGAALGKQLAPGQGTKQLQGMSGRDAYGTILKGFKQSYGGNAQKMADSTLIGVVQNVSEAMNKIMLPTAEALVPALTEGSKWIKETAERVKGFNRVTGGSGGLVALIGAGSLVVRKMSSDFNGAVGSVGRLTSAIETLSTATSVSAAEIDMAKARIAKPMPPVGAGGVQGIGSASWKTTAATAAPYAVSIDLGTWGNTCGITGILDVPTRWKVRLRDRQPPRLSVTR